MEVKHLVDGPWHSNQAQLWSPCMFSGFWWIWCLLSAGLQSCTLVSLHSVMPSTFSLSFNIIQPNTDQYVVSYISNIVSKYLQRSATDTVGAHKTKWSGGFNFKRFYFNREGVNLVLKKIYAIEQWKYVSERKIMVAISKKEQVTLEASPKQILIDIGLLWCSQQVGSRGEANGHIWIAHCLW